MPIFVLSAVRETVATVAVSLALPLLSQLGGGGSLLTVKSKPRRVPVARIKCSGSTV